MIKFDDASWHTEGEFPSDLPAKSGATHIGMFVAWAINRGQLDENLRKEALEEFQAVRQHRLTGRDFVLRVLDGRLADEDLSLSVGQFASDYYDPNYYEDYLGLFPEVPSLYHVADTWQNYAKVERMLDRRFSDWSATR